MTLHDISDPFLEAGKLALYFKYQRIANLLFPFFGTTFIIMRLVYFPIRCIYPAIYLGKVYDKTPWNLILPILFIALIVLLIINFIWSLLIIKLALKIFRNEGEVDDLRDTK